MVYYIATVSFLLLLTVDAIDLDEIAYLPSSYWPMLRYASLTPSSSSSLSLRDSNVPVKRQGIIPGPRVGRSFAPHSDNHRYHQINTNNYNSSPKYNNDYANANNNNANYRPELHEFSALLSGLNNRGKRSLRASDMASSASASTSSSPSSSSSQPSSSLTGTAIDMGNEDSSSLNSMAMFERSVRQLIPAPRVGRSSPTSSYNAFLSSLPSPSSSSSSNLLTGYNQAANSYNRGDDGNGNYETDQQIINGQHGINNNGLVTHGTIELLAVPRPYMNPMIARDLFKRVALTPRIGRSSEGSSPLMSSMFTSNGWLDDDDYYNRVIKSSFTPRVGRSVSVNGEKSKDSKA